MSDVMRLLGAAEAGDRRAAADLLPLVYDELRKLAAARMAAESPGQTLQPTALVHVAYLRLVGDQHFDGRGHFFAAAAEAMRRIVVNHARDRKRLKRGGKRLRLELLDQADSLAEDPDLILSLDELLTHLGEEDATAARVAHLHLFGGLSVQEAGAALAVSRAVAYRSWKHARAWLRDALEKQSRVRQTLFPWMGHGEQGPFRRWTMVALAAQAKSLFLAASDLDNPAERAAYLDRECGGDAERHAGGIKPAGATDFSESLRHIDSVRCGPHRTCSRASRRATTWLGS
jgi:RNA polymerase sigma factor (TIGR02999 family)